MTHAQLKSRLDIFGKTQRRLVLVELAVLFGFPTLLIVGGVFDITVADLPISDTLFAILVWVWLLGPLAMIFVLLKRAQKRYDLLCAHCQKPLTWKWSLVLSTGRCTHCDSPVVEEAI